MMKHSNIDKLTKEILKQSHLEINDPDFQKTIMKNILREHRKRRMLENIFLCILVFVAVDTLVFLGLWLTNMNIFDIAVRLVKMPHALFSQMEKVKNSILGNGLVKYVILSFGGLLAMLMILESKLSERSKQRGN
jgi:hypothetical protein